MIPMNLNDEIIELVDEANQPSYTFGISEDTKIAGMKDGIEAVAQAIEIILNVERYAYLIYSWDFGVEFSDLIGKDPSYACPEIARRVKDALMQDERIKDVDGWSFSRDRHSIAASFTVHTVFGDIEKQKEVEI